MIRICSGNCRRGENGISPTTSLAWNSFVFNWTLDGPRPAALHKPPNGFGSSSRRSNERNLFTCRWRDLERGSAVIAYRRFRLLGTPGRDLWELGRDDNGCYARNRGALTNYWRGAPCCSVARSSRYRRIRLNRSSDHFSVGFSLVGTATQRSGPLSIEPGFAADHTQSRSALGQKQTHAPQPKGLSDHLVGSPQHGGGIARISTAWIQGWMAEQQPETQCRRKAVSLTSKGSRL